uniref:Enkurin domain-containing protein n=1 Tax=Leptobrachium leishanense TaxID=445787 RepID=A0A8C5PS58_9ANUR
METHPEENIYNLIPRAEAKITKLSRYISRFTDSVKAEEKKNRAACKTMGPAELKVPSPKQYLQKHTNEAKLSQKGALLKREPRCLDEGRRRPPVPLRIDHPAMGERSQKSFIKTNINSVTMAEPKKPQPIMVDTNNGDKQVLETSGLVPKYIKKKDFGSTPQYLLKRIREARQAQYDAYVESQSKMGTEQELFEEERQAVIQGLKKNWDDLHHDYQGLSLTIDTPVLKAYKARLEVEMKQLEQDIDLMERHKAIYIATN